MPGLSRHAGQRAGRSRSCSSCRRSSACTSTSRTSAAASPSAATSPSRRSSTRARATCRRSPTCKQIIAEVVSKVPDAQVMSDLDATVAWAGEVEQRRRRASSAITGFCWGGRIVWLYAAHSPDAEGRRRLVRAARRRRERRCSRSIRSTSRPSSRRRCSASTAARTRASRSRDVEQMRAALEGGEASPRRSSSIRTRRTASIADYRPSYNEKEAKEGWAKCLAWFRGHGVG